MMLAGKCQKRRVLETLHFFFIIRNSNSVSCNAMCSGGIRIIRKCGGVTYRKVVESVGQG